MGYHYLCISYVAIVDVILEVAFFSVLMISIFQTLCLQETISVLGN